MTIKLYADETFVKYFYSFEVIPKNSKPFRQAKVNTVQFSVSSSNRSLASYHWPWPISQFSHILDKQVNCIKLRSITGKRSLTKAILDHGFSLDIFKLVFVIPYPVDHWQAILDHGLSQLSHFLDKQVNCIKHRSLASNLWPWLISTHSLLR